MFLCSRHQQWRDNIHSLSSFSLWTRKGNKKTKSLPCSSTKHKSLHHLGTLSRWKRKQKTKSLPCSSTEHKSQILQLQDKTLHVSQDSSSTLQSTVKSAHGKPMKNQNNCFIESSKGAKNKESQELGCNNKHIRRPAIHPKIRSQVEETCTEEDYYLGEKSKANLIK